MENKTSMKRQKKKAAMIAYFIGVFCEQGLDGAYMRRLATSAGVSEGLLYQYFADKNDIIRQCTTLYHEQIQRELTEVIIKHIEKAEQLPGAVLDYIDSVIDICRFLLQVMAHPTYCTMMNETGQQVKGYIGHVAKLFEERLCIDPAVALGSSQLLNSMVNDYILKKSREDFLIQFAIVKRQVWR